MDSVHKDEEIEVDVKMCALRRSGGLKSQLSSEALIYASVCGLKLLVYEALHTQSHEALLAGTRDLIECVGRVSR